MPTAKQVRRHYARVSKLRWKLQRALDDAYSDEVIVYKDGEPHIICDALYTMWDHFRTNTTPALASAMREEINDSMITRRKK